jgi:sporulation protein YlmC with PRC-barrel domain
MLNRENNAAIAMAAPASSRANFGVAGFEDRKLIYASKLRGAVVRNSAGHSVGHIEDIAIDAVTGNIACAVLSLGGFLGVGEHVLPVPWPVLSFDANTHSYRVSLSNDALRAAPACSKSAFSDLRDGDENFPDNIFAYYGIYT